MGPGQLQSQGHRLHTHGTDGDKLEDSEEGTMTTSAMGT